MRLAKESHSQCAKWQRFLVFRIEDIAEAEREALRIHLDECLDCAAMQADYQRIGNVLHNLPTVYPPPEMVERLRAIRKQHSMQEERTKSAAYASFFLLVLHLFRNISSLCSHIIEVCWGLVIHLLARFVPIYMCTQDIAREQSHNRLGLQKKQVLSCFQRTEENERLFQEREIEKLVRSNLDFRAIQRYQEDVASHLEDMMLEWSLATNNIGRTLGSYRLVRVLGKGGFADVYLGQHISSGIHAAIKVPNKQSHTDNGENLYHEAEIVRSLEHRHIVRLREFVTEEEVPFLVMDYAPNGSLQQLHPQGICVPLPTVVKYVKQIADALQYVHERNIIHCDVKPENMLLGRDNEVLLSDFGIARVASSRDIATARTAPYMAPEQIKTTLRPASDQYSLGVVVYEWLCGERPFQGSHIQLAFQHRDIPPLPLREKVPTLSKSVEEVVMRALAKDPDQRFNSVRDFANALEEAMVAQYRLDVIAQASGMRLLVTKVNAWRQRFWLHILTYSHTIVAWLLTMLRYTLHLVKMLVVVMAQARNKEILVFRANPIKRKIRLLVIAILLFIVSILGIWNAYRSVDAHTIMGPLAHPLAGKVAVSVNQMSTSSASSMISFSQSTLPKEGADRLFSRQERDHWSWLIRDTSQYSCQFREEAYYAESKKDNGFAPCIAQTSYESSLILQMNITFLQGGSGGIIFCADYGNAYYFAITSTQQYHLSLRQDDGKQTSVSYGRSGSIQPGLNVVNSVAVALSRNSASFYINDHMVESVDNVNGCSGSIGVFAGGSTAQPTQAVFQDAELWIR